MTTSLDVVPHGLLHASQADLARPDAGRGADLSIIVPTYNEKENVAPLIEQVAAALGSIEWEVIFVDDDSPDGTAATVRTIAQTSARIRCIQRIGRRGLSTAVVEGVLASSAPVVAVMDGDLQHDPALLPVMLRKIRVDTLDVVVASRYVQGGTVGQFDGDRVAISTAATKMARLVVSADLADPMSGFFVITREAFDSSVRRLSGQGFKILLDLFASAPRPYRFAEVPLSFRNRVHGESKLDSAVALDYVSLLLDKLCKGYVPARFVLFAAVGTFGVAVHLAVLRLTLSVFGFGMSQALATIAAMTSNFLFNNALTYRDQRLRGRKRLTGLLTFYGVCSVGAVANVGIAASVFERHYSWWLSGLAGAAVGVVWNYSVSSIVTWRRHAQR